MPLSSMPTPGPTLPDGCTSVKVKSTAADPSSSSNRVDVTTLEDDERIYATAPLIDAGQIANGSGVTQTVTASFFGVAPSVSAPGSTGWVCTEVETDYTVGEFIKGTATYIYVPPEA